MGYPQPYVSGTLPDGESAAGYCLNLLSSCLAPIDAVMLAHYLKTWCEHHCIGEWRVEQDHRQLRISLKLDRDLVLFMLTEEYDLILRHAA